MQVPPYARAGLYKQLATLKDLLREFREDATKNASLRPVIAANMQQAGLYEDLPYSHPGGGEGGGVLTAEAAEELPAEGEVCASEVPSIGRDPAVRRFRFDLISTSTSGRQHFFHVFIYYIYICTVRFSMLVAFCCMPPEKETARRIRPSVRPSRVRGCVSVVVGWLFVALAQRYLSPVGKCWGIGRNKIQTRSTVRCLSVCL